MNDCLINRRHCADELKRLIRSLDIGGTAFDTRIQDLVQKSDAREQEDFLNDNLNPYLDKLEDIYDAIFGLFLNMNTCDMACNVAHIKPGTSIGNRNVATSRIAEFLGIGKLVVKSEMKEVEIKGVKQRCLEMEEARGEESLAKANNVRERGGYVQFVLPFFDEYVLRH